MSQMNQVKFITFVIYFLSFFLLINPWLNWLYFILGMLVGLGLLLADEKWGYQFYLADELEKLEADQKEVVRFSQLITRSALFVMSLIPIGLFVVTSSGSFLAEGIYMGIVLGLLVEMIQLRSMPALFKSRFLQDVKLQTSPAKITNQVTVGSFLFFVVINLLFIF